MEGVSTLTDGRSCETARGPVPWLESDDRDPQAHAPDPLVMYLVAPHRSTGSAGALLADAARAALRCTDAFRSRPAWSSAFEEWERSSFRKVCLRATGAEFEAARALPHAQAGEVLCFPPRRRSAAEPELGALRAHTGGPLSPAAHPLADPPAERPAAPPAGPLLNSRPGTMLLLVDEDLHLTAGKACAQVAHAILLAVECHPAAAIDGWRRAGCPVAVALLDGDGFTRAQAELPVAAVRDAGFTQVRAGTETVLATQPDVPVPDWLRSRLKPVA